MQDVTTWVLCCRLIQLDQSTNRTLIYILYTPQYFNTPVY